MTQTDTILTLGPNRTTANVSVGAFAYGCWRFSGSTVDAARAKLIAALEVTAASADAGTRTLVDTAPIYGFGAEGFGDAEARLGAVLAADPRLRDQIVLVTKAGIHPPLPYDSSAANLIASCEASLKRLGVDHIDVFLIHRPDLLSHPADVASALAALQEAGKVGAVGVSNYTPEQTRALQRHLPFDLAVTQPEISLMAVDALQDGTLDLAQERGMTPMAWSPLAGGALATGGSDARLSRIITVLDSIAERDSTGRDAVALAWLLAHPAGIIPIIGSQSPDRIRASGAAFDVKLTRRDWYALLEASLGRKMP